MNLNFRFYCIALKEQQDGHIILLLSSENLKYLQILKNTSTTGLEE